MDNDYTQKSFKSLDNFLFYVFKKLYSVDELDPNQKSKLYNTKDTIVQNGSKYSVTFDCQALLLDCVPFDVCNAIKDTKAYRTGEFFELYRRTRYTNYTKSSIDFNTSKALKSIVATTEFKKPRRR